MAEKQGCTADDSYSYSYSYSKRGEARRLNRQSKAPDAFGK
jgi:hypothetical protein